jgi:glutathione S-transferase
MKFYGSIFSPFVARVALVIREKGLDITLEYPPGGDMKSPEFLAISPFGKVPAMVLDDGTPMIESEVICEYLDEIHPAKPILPADPLARAHVRTLSRAVDLYILAPLLPLLGQANPATRDEAVVTQKLADLDKGLKGLEKLATPDPWLAGADFTLADAAFIPTGFFLDRFMPAFGRPEPLADLPKLAAAWAHAKSLPENQTLIKEMGEALQAFFKRRAAQG